MAQLAIKGHKTRGKEVIQLLEILGGKNKYNLRGDTDEWFVLNGTQIQRSDRLFAERGFTLEEFEDNFPYKVGDKVIAWVNGYRSICNIQNMEWDSIPNEIKYKIQDYWYSTINLQPYKEENYCQVIGNDTSNEGIDLQKLEKQLDKALEKETKESLEEFFFGDPEPQPKAPILSKRYDYAAGKCGYVIPDGYEFDYIKNGFQKEIILKPIVEHKSHQTDIDTEQENTKTSFTFDCIRNEKGENQLIIPSDLEVIIEDEICILREKKPQYPKGYEECCKILNIPFNRSM